MRFTNKSKKKNDFRVFRCRYVLSKWLCNTLYYFTHKYALHIYYGKNDKYENVQW